MRNASPALIAYLNTTKTFLMADLYTFTLVGGVVARYTDADINIGYDGNIYYKFLIARTKTKNTIGIEVDEMSVTVNATPLDLLLNQSWLAAARNGALDGAQLTVSRLFMPTWGNTSLGALVLFSGKVSDVNIGRTTAEITVKSELELFDTQMPRDLYQSGCLNTLYDNGCTVNKASMAVSGTVATATTAQITSALGQPADYFALGSIQFTSGANNGVTKSVRSFSGGVFSLSSPLTTAPVPGDTFTAWPGCDKLKDTCEDKFSNLLNFRGFPFVPDPETAT